MSEASVLAAAHAGALGRLRETGEDAYQALLEQVPGVLYVAEVGVDGRWLYVSPQVEDVLGWTPQEWMADPTLFTRCMHPEDRPAQDHLELSPHLVPGGRYTTEYRLNTRSGGMHWFRDDARLLCDESGRPSAWTGVLTDITEQRRSEQLLTRTCDQSRAILDTAMDAYVAFDEQGTICDWNRTAERLFGWRREAVVGRTLAETLVPGQSVAGHQRRIEEALAAAEPGAGRILQATVVRRDGSQLPVELTVWRGREDDTVRLHAFLRDITDRRNLQAQLVRQAYRDELTGLPNRALLQRRTAERMAVLGRRGLAVLLVGIDDFGSVNESLGHAAADELVRAVADRLHDDVPGCDTLARLSDDEFAILLVDVPAASEADRRAKSLQAALRAPARCAGREITLRLSIGVRHCPAGAEVGVEELLSDAGAAMSTARRTGRTVVLFENSMRADRLRRLHLTEALEHAVDRGEIYVHYQPYFSFPDLCPCGVEALARWRHPVYGDVSPSEFIVLAENTGQIQSLGSFVLRRACQDIARLRAADARYRGLSLSVNVSARQLVDGRLQRDLRAVLEETGLPGEGLMLELTETALVEDSRDVAERLADIRGMGVHLAVDDFGTRYASLTYLQRFPIDTLKVDRTFVQSVHQSPADQRLTGAIITLAKTLGLRTIAEGVEEEEHAARLAGLGCDAGQGFLFARPVALDRLPAALSAAPMRRPGNSQR